MWVSRASEWGRSRKVIWSGVCIDGFLRLEKTCDFTGSCNRLHGWLHFWVAFLGVLLFAFFLADDAALGGRVGLQAGEVDVVAAVDADAEFAVLDAPESGFDVAYPLNLAVHHGHVEIRQGVRHRLVAGIAGLAVEQVDAVLFTGVFQLVAHLAQQRLVIRLEFLDELVKLGLGKCGHRTTCACCEWAKTYP